MERSRPRLFVKERRAKKAAGEGGVVVRVHDVRGADGRHRYGAIRNAISGDAPALAYWSSEPSTSPITVVRFRKDGSPPEVVGYIPRNESR